jgi:hypothetical protein
MKFVLHLKLEKGFYTWQPIKSQLDKSQREHKHFQSYTLW